MLNGVEVEVEAFYPSAFLIIQKRLNVCGKIKKVKVIGLKIGVVIGTNDPETVWNAFRFGTVALKANHTVKVFLVNKGVEAEDIKSEKFNVKEQIDEFIGDKGELLACGTCMKARLKESSNYCPIATMNDLLSLVEESDKVLTFG